LYNAKAWRNDFVPVQVCREGEAIGVATGLLLGGKNPVVLHQSTGFFESGDSLRGLALDLNIPLLLLIGHRGWHRNFPVTDSAAKFLEPVLDAWHINHYLVETDQDVQRISTGYREAQQTNRPVAVLFGRDGISS